MIFQDDTGYQAMIREEPEKIISLCPSFTETLFDLGAGKRVAGITDYCVHPSGKLKNIPRIGGPRNPDIEKILQLSPDLVLASKGENQQADILQLRKRVPVITFDIKSFLGAHSLVLSLGRITGNFHQALNFAEKMEELFMKEAPCTTIHRVLYLIWKDPWMAAGHATYINSILSFQGFRNVLPEDRKGYPEVTPDTAGVPEYVFLSSEPYPFKARHFREIREAFPGAEPVLVDGEMFGWYGTRVIKAIPYIRLLKKELTAGRKTYRP